MSFDFASNDVLLDIEAVCKKLSISRSTLERLRRSRSDLRTSFVLSSRDDEFAGMPSFPEPTIMLGRSPRWSSLVLNKWINSPTRRAG